MVFVEGAPRSGTTLLVSMLASHPRVAGTVAESHLFDRGVGTLFDNHERQDRYEGFLANYVSEPELTDLTRDLCDGVLETMRSRVKPGADFVTEKTPLPRRGAEAAMRRKLAVFPDAAYVHVVRERDDVVASLMRAPWADCDAAEAAAWRDRAVTAIRETAGAADPGPYIEIPYEELAADPVGVVSDVLERLGLECDAEVESRLRAASRERISSFGPAPPPGTPDAGSSPARPDGAGSSSGPGLAGALRVRARGLAGRIEGWRGRRTTIAQDLLVAARRADSEQVAALTHPAFAFALRSGAGDLVASGEQGRAGLIAVAGEVFRTQAVSESWTAVSEGEATVLMLAAGHGDGRRTDLTAAALVRGGRVERLSLICAGEPGGRQPLEWRVPS